MTSPAQPPLQLERPNIADASRSTDECFVLWSRTPVGKEEIARWSSVFVGLGYQSTDDELGHKRFLRELLTQGTILNGVMKRGFCGSVTAKGKMAVASLTSRKRALTAKGVRDAVNRGFGSKATPAAAALTKEEIINILDQEDLMSDNDFVIIGSKGKGESLFFTPQGQENKILKKGWTTTRSV
jgi:hypothetical protein